VFNPLPAVQRIALGDAAVCIIDDALQEPGRWVELASRHAGSFVEAPSNAYPGIELPMPDSIVAQCMAFFDQHLRAGFGLRRMLHGHAKLALATHPEARLQPFQVIPHVDRQHVEAGQAAMASVLYLFKDEALGGTSFYRPRADAARLAGLFGDAARLDAGSFCALHGLPRAYPAAGNHWFEHVLTVPPRWNRLIVYPGTVFHSSHLPDPSKLQADPGTGRLTLNGFFTCKRALAA
jgi:hypothetical protein